MTRRFRGSSDGRCIPPNDFTGRWPQLWWLHSALHADAGQLTSRPTTPIVVVHGIAGIGKTSLAAEYVRRFGATFPGGVYWHQRGTEGQETPSSTDRSDLPRTLWILDDAVGTSTDVRRQLPDRAGLPCLILTRDARLAGLGNSLELGDLSESDAAQLIGRHLPSDARPETIAQITTATAGSPALAATVARLAERNGPAAALKQLHDRTTETLTSASPFLTLDSADTYHWDVLRALAALAPHPMSLPRLADVLAQERGTERLSEIEPVQSAVLELLGIGILPGTTDADELALPNASRLTVQRLDPDPARGERLRSHALRDLIDRPRYERTAHQASDLRTHYTDEVRRAAHRLKVEATSRISFRPLAHDEGSSREALSSLYRLMQVTREIQVATHPAALRAPTPTQAGLGTLTENLMGELRAMLTRWHIELGAHEDRKPPGVARIDHERAWEKHERLRQDLDELRNQVLEIATELSAITGDPLDLSDLPTTR